MNELNEYKWQFEKKKPKNKKKQNKKVGEYLGTYVQYVSLD